MKARNIRDAYPIQEAKRQSNKARVQYREAVAWISEGRLRFSFKGIPRGGNPVKEQRRIYLKWLKAVPGATDSNEVVANHKSPTRYARCVACTRSAIVEAWREQDVYMHLLAARSEPDHELSFIPIERTPWDPDKSLMTWLTAQKEPMHQRLAALGRALLLEAAGIYVLGVELIGDFEAEFAKEDGMLVRYDQSAARTLLDARNAIQGLIFASNYCAPTGREVDAATAARQGFLIGRWLTHAQAMIHREALRRLSAGAGIGAAKSMKFWDWSANHPNFKNKRAKQIWTELDGADDPDFPKMRMRLDADNCLHHGKGRPLTYPSFAAQLSQKRPSYFRAPDGWHKRGG
jgi:hypothetical protein